MTRGELDLVYLRSFLVVARLESFTAAAKELGLSQPAVSGHVRKLEAALGHALVELSGGRARLTAGGQLLLESGPEVLAAAERLHDGLARLGGLGHRTLRVGASTTPGVHVLPRILRALSAAHPELAVSCTIRGSAQIEELLARGEIDCGIVGGKLSAHELELEALVDDELVLVAPAGHALAGRAVGRRELESEAWVLRERGSATRRRLEEFLGKLGLAPRAAVEVDSPAAVKAMVGAGLGLSAVSRFSLETGDALAVLDAKPIRRELSLAYRSDRAQAPALQAFARAARGIAKTLTRRKR